MLSLKKKTIKKTLNTNFVTLINVTFSKYQNEYVFYNVMPIEVFLVFYLLFI